MESLNQPLNSRMFGLIFFYFFCLISIVLILSENVGSVEFNGNSNKNKWDILDLNSESMSKFDILSQQFRYPSVILDRIKRSTDLDFVERRDKPKGRPRGKGRRQRQRQRQPSNDNSEVETYSTIPKNLKDNSFQNPENSFVPPPINSNNFYQKEKEFADNPIASQWKEFAELSEKEKRQKTKGRNGKITELRWTPKKSQLRISMEKIMNSFNEMCSSLLTNGELSKILCTRKSNEETN